MDLRAVDFEFNNEQLLRTEYLSVDIVSQQACMDSGTLRATKLSLLRQLRKAFTFSKDDHLTFFVDNKRGGKAEMTVELLLKHYAGE